MFAGFVAALDLDHGGHHGTALRLFVDVEEAVHGGGLLLGGFQPLILREQVGEAINGQSFLNEACLAFFCEYIHHGAKGVGGTATERNPTGRLGKEVSANEKVLCPPKFIWCILPVKRFSGWCRWQRGWVG